MTEEQMVAIYEKFIRSGKKKAKRYMGPDKSIEQFRLLGRKYVRDIQKGGNVKSGTPITYVDTAEVFELNASAFTKDGGDFISLNHGCVPILRNYFNYLLRNAAVFPGIGDGSIEAIPMDFDPLQDLDWPDEVDPPVNPERRFVANFLAATVLEFIIAHEIGHINLGHVHLDKELFGLNEIDELYGHSGNSARLMSADQALTSQTFEMSADAFAVAQGVVNINRWVEIAKSGKLNDYPNCKSLFSTYDGAVRLWLYAVLSFFRIIAYFQSFTLDSMYEETHPKARLRFSWTLRSLVALSLIGKLKVSQGTCMKIAFEVAGQVERDSSIATNSEIDKAGILIAEGAEADDYLEKLNRRWDELVPRLKEIAYSPHLIQFSPYYQPAHHRKGNMPLLAGVLLLLAALTTYAIYKRTR